MSKPQFSSSGFELTYETLWSSFSTGKTKSLKWRKWQLKQLYWLIDENEDALLSAMAEDLHRHPCESLSTDINETKSEILEMIANIDQWAKGEAPTHAGFLFGWIGKAWIRKEPFGVALVIGAWNFPLGTLFGPAIAAIAAGNAVLLKPSDLAPACEKLITELVLRYLDTSAVNVVSAGPEDMATVLKARYGFIFYTGGSRVGRIVATAAANHVTPTALELGGQAPGIVTKHANIDLTAKRLANAKLMNLGQVCVNVNHVFADPDIYDDLLERLTHWMSKFVEEGSDTLACMINRRHFDRVRALVEGTSGTVLYTGEHRSSTNALHPTIVSDVTMEDSLLSEELFGPVLPVIKADINSAIKFINQKPTPLGMYIFSEKQSEVDHILNSTNSGGVTVNDVAVHADVPSAPFGGVGESGYGSYHGKWGFDTFSHNRTVLHMPGSWVEYLTKWRYPPFSLANRGQIDIARPKFKKGETMDDQRESKGLLGWGSGITSLIIACGAYFVQCFVSRNP